MSGGLMDSHGATRTSSGLQALYDFRSTEGSVVKDRSGVGVPLNLKISNPKAVQRSEGALEVKGKTLIRSDKAATKIINAVKKTGELTMETWVRPFDTSLSGPARIITISKDSNQRNVTLGQDGSRFEVRFRTTQTSANGIPELTSPDGSLARQLIHVVYTRDRSGRARLYLNGKKVTEKNVPGDVSNWNASFPLALANELNNERPWKGTYYLVAIYNRDLLAREVSENFKAGSGLQSVPAPLVAGNGGTRATSGLQVLYDFNSSSGPIVRDQSGVGDPLDLKISNLKAVQRTEGTLEVKGNTLIRSDKAAFKIINAVRKTGELSMEAWLRPSDTSLSGPARILTISKDTSQRNVTLGQDGNKFDIRFRTTQTDANGNPSLSSPDGSLVRELTHMVYTRDRSGRARVYLNGVQTAEKKVPGDVSNWIKSFPLALGNEISGERPWKGIFYLVAVYNRDLSPNEVTQNYQAGAHAKSSPALLAQRISPNGILFNSEIAPILAEHCLECHDASTRKGGLDLSHKLAAMKGGKSGDAIVPGKSGESLVWDSVFSDEMPDEGEPLSDHEKKVLKDWIDGGATWTMETIDPSFYAHSGTASGNWVRRLTVEEYINTVKSAVDVDISKEARELLPPDLRADGFANTAYNLNVDFKHVEMYSRLAEKIVERMDVIAFARQYSKSNKLTDDSMRDVIGKMGKWLLRGPLMEHEIVAYRGISTTPQRCPQW